MQHMALVPKMTRTAVMTIALLAALAFGSVAAEPIEVGLTECDHGCAIETLSGDDQGGADFQVTEVAALNGWDAYVSAGPADVGFTE